MSDLPPVSAPNQMGMASCPGAAAPQWCCLAARACIDHDCRYRPGPEYLPRARLRANRRGPSPTSAEASSGAVRLSREAPPAFRSAAGVTTSFQQVLQRDGVQHRIGQRSLELAGLILQRPQAPGLGHVPPAKFRLEPVEGRRGDAVLATAVAAPASCSFNIPMIRSSGNRGRHIVRLLQ